MRNSIQKISKLLRARPDVIEKLELEMMKITGKTGVFEKISEEIEMLIDRTLQEFGLDRAVCTAEEVEHALVSKMAHTDQHLYEYLGRPDLSRMSHVCGKVCDVAQEVSGVPKGFFIKREKVASLLKKDPPTNLLTHFGYSSVEELIDAQGLTSVLCSLRFAQDDDWMHRFFDKAYGSLTAEDFEEREVEIKVLETLWLDVAAKFTKHKLHNVSHLKEHGIIFITPLKSESSGETLRMFMLLLHYLNEVPFYSKLFIKYSKDADFVDKLQSLLRGDVLEGSLPIDSDSYFYRIVQRYLAKDDENDFRLLEPHVNPEAGHWYLAEGDLGKIRSDEFATSLGYWQGLDFVGGHFKSVDGSEKMVSFDFIDIDMTLVEKEKRFFTYHLQEALWNKIFIEYLGRDKLNQLIEENLIKGFITL